MRSSSVNCRACAVAQTRAAPACSSTAPRTPRAAGATWPLAGIARKPPGIAHGSSPADRLRRVDVVRTYLALDDPAQFRPSQVADASARVERRDPCSVALYRRLYHEVGERWYWHERLQWSDAVLEEHLTSPNVSVWELLVDGESGGYFE